MGINLVGILSVIVSLGSFWVVYRATRGWAISGKLVWFVVATIFAIPGLSFAFYYTDLIPENASYYQFRSLPFVEFCLIPIGIAGGICAGLFPRFLLILPLLGVALFSMVPFLKPMILPLVVEFEKEQWRDGVCQQSTGATCGPASMATVLKQLGIEAGEAELARAAHTYGGGTEAWYLARSARKRGARVVFRIDEEGFPAGFEAPAIIGVKLGSIGHFISILEVDGSRYLIGDPMRRKMWVERDELDRMYTSFTGFVMEVSVAN